MHSRIRTAGFLAAITLIGAALSACGDDTSTGDADASPTAASSSADAAELNITVTGDTVTPEAEEVDLSVGETLTMNVTSDRDGELHVHSDPEHAFEFTSGRHQYTVTFDTPGRSTSRSTCRTRWWPGSWCADRRAQRGCRRGYR